MKTILTTLNSLIAEAGVNQSRTVVVRHRPFEPALTKVFPWIVAERPDLFVAYQRAQWGTLKAAMAKADHMIAFVGLEPGEAVVTGVFRIGEHQTLTQQKFMSIPENAELLSLGMTRMKEGDTTHWFDLHVTPILEDAHGRMVIGWPGLELSWWRWANRNTFPVVAFNQRSRFEQAMPDWNDFILGWSQLQNLPRSWHDRLSQWRGIYLITDVEKRAAYVGSAYGADNILGRWMDYRRTGHGGNKRLRESDPANLHFSILELTAPSLPMDAVIRLEANWKDRLHSRVIGLNEN